MMSEKQRIQCIDIIKGLAILLVVVSHLMSSYTGLTSFLTRVFGGLMGVFFILSGYFYKPGKGYWFNVKKRFSQILLPMLFYNLIVLGLCLIYQLIIGANIDLLDYLKTYLHEIYDKYALQPITLGASSKMTAGAGMTSIDTILGHVLGGSWFLNRMFFSSMIFFAVADWAGKSVKHISLTVFVSLSVTVLYLQFLSVHLPMQLENCFAVAALFLFGSYMRKIDFAAFIEFGPWNRKKKIITGIILICYVAAGMRLYNFFGTVLSIGDFGTAGSVSVYIWFVCQVICFYVMLLFGTYLGRVPFISDFLKLLGRHTLIILLFHLLFGLVSRDILRRIFGYSDEEVPFWIALASVVTAVLLSLAVSLLRDKIKARLAGRKSTAKA